MYNMKSIILICFFTLSFYTLGCLSKVQSCYACASGSDSNCLDPYNKTDSQSRQCADGAHRSLIKTISNETRRNFDPAPDPSTESDHRCIKVTLVFPNGKSQLIRTCSPIQEGHKTACEAWEKNYKTDSCHECDKDNCNSGSKLYVTAILFAATIFLFLFN